MLFLVGGPSQLDTWDMKPNAPAEIRGPYKPIKTNVPGIQIQRDLPADGEARRQVRAGPVACTRRRAVHDTGHQMMQTGRLFQGGIESSARRLRAGQAQGTQGRRARRTCCCRARSATPAATCRTARTAGFLGKPYDPFVLNADPSDPNFQVPDLLPPDYLTAMRVDRRRNLRELVDGVGEGLRSHRRTRGCSTRPSSRPTR